MDNLVNNCSSNASEKTLIRSICKNGNVVSQEMPTITPVAFQHIRQNGRLIIQRNARNEDLHCYTSYSGVLSNSKGARKPRNHSGVTRCLRILSPLYDCEEEFEGNARIMDSNVLDIQSGDLVSTTSGSFCTG